MKFLAFVRGVVLLVARIGLGGVLIAHGWRRWQEQGITSQIDYLTRSGIPRPEVFAYGSVVLELVGGLLLVVGLLTPLVAAAVLAEQIVIIAWTSWNRGLYLTDAAGAYVGGFEFTVVLGLLALVFVAFGAGPASLDRLFRRRTPVQDEAEADPEPAGRTRTARVGAGV